MLKDLAKERESWHSGYGGSKNAGKVAVLKDMNQISADEGGALMLLLKEFTPSMMLGIQTQVR